MHVNLVWCVCCVVSGLSLRDYLEGREAKHNELMMRVYGGKKALMLDDSTTFLDREDLKGIKPVKLGKVTEDLMLESMRRHDAGEDNKSGVACVELETCSRQRVPISARPAHSIGVLMVDNPL